MLSYKKILYLRESVCVINKNGKNNNHIKLVF